MHVSQMTKRTKKVGVTGKYGVVSFGPCTTGCSSSDPRPLTFRSALRSYPEEVHQEDGNYSTCYLHVSLRNLSASMNTARCLLLIRVCFISCTFCGKVSLSS